jgi:uncharacterized protein
MLSAKPWKLDAIVRLLAGVFTCIFMGLLLMSVCQSTGRGHRVAAAFYALAAAALGFSVATLMLIRKPWGLEDLGRRLIITAGCFYASFAFGMVAQHYARPVEASVSQMLFAVLSFQGAAVLLVWLFVREHHVGWKEAFGFDNGRGRAVLLGLGLACVFLPLTLALQWVSARVILPRLHLVPEEQQAVETLRLAHGWVARAALGAVTILVAPLAEELLFRGILYPWIKQVGFPRLALWGTSLVFAAIHLNVATFLPLTALALALALLYERTDNLLAPIAAHAAFNAFNFGLLFVSEWIMGKLQ